MTSQPMTITELSVVFGLLIGATEPLRKLSGVVSGINSGSACANILYPLLDSQTQIVDPAVPQTLSKPHSRIEFNNVTFSYDGQHNVLTNVNLVIPFRERLAVIGPNGGGKSTLTNLLCRFFDPQQGTVMIDGIAEVIDAAKKAKAHDFISEFAEGYQTMMGPNGQRLSGGQRQRIALARALLRRSEILILDEATNQIDVDSELLIHESLLNYAQDRTLIMVTHRQSTLDLATRIVQVDRGTITEIPVNKLKAA